MFVDDIPKLEPNYTEQFNAWQLKPTKSTMGSLLKQVQPSIDKGISAHVGNANANPMLRSRARKIAVQAIRSYKPQTSKLETHIINQLQGLKRISRQQQQIVKVPERISLESNMLQRASDELEDEHGREPTASELADRTGLSMRRLKRIRSYHVPMAEGAFASGTEESEGFLPAVENSASEDAWVELIYDDMDTTNKKIMEWTIGMHGHKKMSNQNIARKLGVSPGAVSQRKAQIQKQLSQIELSPF
jgi:DNA-directed RNA polymerase specialized sigma subunit